MTTNCYFNCYIDKFLKNNIFLQHVTCDDVTMTSQLDV